MKRGVVPKLALLMLASACAHAQLSSGSDGHDGVLAPTSSTVINMADHPDGVYHYTSVNIPNGARVSFIPNAANTPVVWLVQGDALIYGVVDLGGAGADWAKRGLGGPGGFGGGSGGLGGTPAQGPGSGIGGVQAGNASFATSGDQQDYDGGHLPAGAVYGSPFLIPLIGGSGGGGSPRGYGGGGGGGAILIAAGTITLHGAIVANGGPGFPYYGGSGSGGGVRLYAETITGRGGISVAGGDTMNSSSLRSYAGAGRIRFDCYENNFSGSLVGEFTQGFQPVILPPDGSIPRLTVVSVGGIAISTTPTGVLATPDVILSAEQASPVPIVVRCANVPLNSPITVSVRPVGGAAVSAVGFNNSGTLSTSTVTVLLEMPRGGGVIQASTAGSN